MGISGQKIGQREADALGRTLKDKTFCPHRLVFETKILVFIT
jgi:hypothetical protein